MIPGGRSRESDDRVWRRPEIDHVGRGQYELGTATRMVHKYYTLVNSTLFKSRKGNGEIPRCSENRTATQDTRFHLRWNPTIDAMKVSHDQTNER